MYNKNEIIELFVKNQVISKNKELKSSNLIAKYIDNDKRVLINYRTPIAIIKVNEYNTLYLNKDKYSRTTSKNQNLIRYYASLNNMQIVELTENEIMEMYWRR